MNMSTAFAALLASAIPWESQGPTALDETRVTMDKWIETQQIISKERKDWEQGKEILLGRLDLVKNEITLLRGKIQEAETGAAEADKKRDELLAKDAKLTEVIGQLTQVVTRLEGELRPLIRSLPEPVKARLELLVNRIPEDPATTKATAAERFQNVLGILNEINKANNEINVNYEVHELAGGKPSEVQAIYVGLAQAYYVSGGGEAGIGRPGPEGWKWEPSKAVADDVLMALEILQGKHTPAFVPLPMVIQ